MTAQEELETVNKFLESYEVPNVPEDTEDNSFIGMYPILN